MIGPDIARMFPMEIDLRDQMRSLDVRITTMERKIEMAGQPQLLQLIRLTTLQIRMQDLMLRRVLQPHKTFSEEYELLKSDIATEVAKDDEY